MADLTYSVSTLAELGREMTELSSGLADEPEMTGLDVLHLARAEIVSALQEFETDWSTQRRAMASRLRASGQLASEASTSFSEADRLLAEAALTEADQ